MSLIADYIQEEIKKVNRIKQKCDLMGVKYPYLVRVYMSLSKGDLILLKEGFNCFDSSEQEQLIEVIRNKKTTLIELLRSMGLIFLLPGYGDYRDDDIMMYSDNFSDLKKLFN